LTISVRTLHMQSHLDNVCGLPVPRQQFIESIDRMSVNHALEHVAQVGIEFDSIKLASFDERAQHGPAHTTSIAAREQMILATESHRTNGAFNWIDVEFDAAIPQGLGQSIPSRQFITDRFGKLSAPGQKRKLRLHPKSHAVLERALRAASRLREIGCDFAIRCEQVHRRRRIWSAPTALIAHRPTSAPSWSALDPIEHRDRGIVSNEMVGAKHVLEQQIVQRFEPPARPPTQLASGERSSPTP
jgi:hypothetical protein